MKNVQDSMVEGVTASGERIEARLVRLGRFDAVLELSGAFHQLRTSQKLTALKITSGPRGLYEGPATVRHLVNTHDGLVCEVALDETGLNLEMLPQPETAGYEDFARIWLASNQITPAFKAAVTDMAVYCDNLRAWMNQLEVVLRADGPQRAAENEKAFLNRIAPRVVAAVNALHERFEELAGAIRPEDRGAHQNHVWRVWGPYYLGTPFGHRTRHKPLGYAGDYEMMNMIMRKTFEGRSLYEKVMHYWLVSQWPAESVRNRIVHLQENLVGEVARVARTGRRARILNIGCGPAWEAQEFLKATALSSEADFTLLDFNEETLAYVRNRLGELICQHGRRATVAVQQSTVQQMMRSALQGKAVEPGQKYDFIYCAGLFDYLSDTTCKALVNLFFQWLHPGGLVLVANMNDSRPFRHMVEFLLDWHLIYRNSRFMASLCPHHPEAVCCVITEATTVNLFTHVRHVPAG